MTPNPITTLHLLAYIYIAFADIDSNASEEELDLVIQKIKERLNDEPETSNELLNESFDWYLSARTAENIPSQINEHQGLLDILNTAQKQSILSDLEEIAQVDGEINSYEENFIQAMTRMLELE